MIQFDELGICFKWVGEKPPTSDSVGLDHMSPLGAKKFQGRQALDHLQNIPKSHDNLFDSESTSGNKRWLP